MNLRIRTLIIGYVLIILISGFYTFLDSFLRAWVHPNKSVLISINNYGEGLFELITLVLGAGLLPIVFYYLIIDSIHAEYWRKQYGNSK